jgi:hypothetical protein
MDPTEDGITRRARLEALLSSIREHAPTFRIDGITELVKYGEPTSALEHLCDNLYEAKVALTPEIREELVALSKAYRAGGAYWRWLIPEE